MNHHMGPARSLCVIGCGPRGASIVERILANVPALYGDRPLDLHIVDPYPPGAGRTWRTDQPGLLWMNSAAEHVTMYPDESVDCAGPPRPGPTTAGWLDAPLHDGAYAARRDQGRYLRHFFDTVTRQRPASIRLFVHRARVIDLVRTAPDEALPDAPPAGRQQVILDSGEPPFLADRVVFAQGHTETLAAPTPPGLLRIGPGPADPDALDRIPPGAPVVVRGLGLVFIDCLALLTEGRGGRFVRTPDGALRYLPSGREPRLYAGSRRGVPLPPKPARPLSSALPAPPAGLRFATVDACRAWLSRPGASFARDAWPLVLAELGWCHYRALFAGQPARTRMTWQDFDAQYALLITDADRLAKLAREAVPDPADRFDLDRLAAPLAGLRCADTDDLQRQLHGHLAEVLRRRTGPARGVETALVDALQRVGAVIEELWRAGDLDPTQVTEALGHFAIGTHLSSGPPPLRAEQLLALAEAGIVTFVGPDMRVEITAGTEGAPAPAVFRATGPALPGTVHEARVLLDARLAPPDPDRAADPLLRALTSRGELVPERGADGTPSGLLQLSGASLHPVDAHGTEHQDRIIAGPAQFPRPGTNAVYFRQNDTIARSLLGGD
ncbi:FAD/NAD(P)-binding protein [Streptomyces inhibens]|uniref:FAD/NAD(P)-binding protein n=1 Tax=Streptomyces inhibens TaxID=2293571 RepID=UPI001EE73EFD|nr:FAD/NAD(P)-binding protein [Streptomyces inhibens]UKY51303.1 FAD/NAD(P)-binding protein [Streptomyces inhibens]